MDTDRSAYPCTIVVFSVTELLLDTGSSASDEAEATFVKDSEAPGLRGG
jgi:hypothetical protein